MVTERLEQKRRSLPGFEIVVGIVVAAALLNRVVAPYLSGPHLQTWATIFVATLLQAMPFLVLGVAMSGAIAAFISADRMQRLLPRNPVGAVATAGSAGLLLPGCECGSVPISGRLIAGGARPAAALTFMLSAPAINPVVLVSTAVAFPGRPGMVAARFIASLVTAIVMGLLWLRADQQRIVDRAMQRVQHGASRWWTFALTARHDFLQAGGFLVLGAAAAAAIQAFTPRGVLDQLGGIPVVAILGMATLAIVLSICSEADAFIAASFTQVSPTAQLTFMVVGPTVDLKLISMQSGVFGGRFASRFAPVTAIVAIAMALAVGWWLL
ncbi:MAG TPA: permease [Acidimicrobiia bacterium]|nr:permease [Acidimicrobiia bacterium]